MPKKKFIDKKKAVTFQLVHRSQQDPLITDETAPQHVLLETKSKPQQQQQNDKNNNKEVVPEDGAKRKKELQKYGIFFDDDYDYLQHLHAASAGKDHHWQYIEPANLKRDPKTENSASIQLPSSVFASEFEEDVGLLRKAVPIVGPQPTWDPDIVATLDDDFDFNDPNNELDDNFMELATKPPDNDDDDISGSNSDTDNNNNSGSDDDDDEYKNHYMHPYMNKFLDGNNNNNNNDDFDREETKSRFTEYSMTSSVNERRNQLALLDERFERFYNAYDDTELGPLEMEDIEGVMDAKDILVQNMIEIKKRDDKYLEYNKEWDRKRLRKIEEESSDSEEELVEMEVNDDEDEKGKKWDCQSILSNYSNIYNHPKVIEEPRRRRSSCDPAPPPPPLSSKIEINPKTGVPLNVFHNENANKLTTKTLTKFNNAISSGDDDNDTNIGPKSLCDESVLSTLSILSIRPKDETAEEKRERKRLVREYRQERRIERKSNTLAFKEEKERQCKIALNMRNNLQGNIIV